MDDPTAAQRIAECGRDLAVAPVPAFTSAAGVHIPTMIAACARMAGTYLFRSFAFDVFTAPRGQAVLSLEAAEHTPLLLRTCAGILQSLGTTIANEPPTTLGTGTRQPTKTLIETQAILDPLYAPAQAKFALNDRQMAQAAAVAARMIVRHVAKYVDPNTGYGIVAFAFTEGSRTVPAPLPSSAGAT